MKRENNSPALSATKGAGDKFKLKVVEKVEELETVDCPAPVKKEKHIKMSRDEFDRFVRDISINFVEGNLMYPTSKFIGKKLKDKNVVSNPNYITEKTKSLLKRNKLKRVAGNKIIWI